MGQDAINNILEGLKIGHARRAEQARTELEQQRLQNERDSKEAEIKIRHDSLDEQKRQFDAAQKVISAKAALDSMQQKQEIAKGIMQGVPVPGATQQPQGGTDQQPFSPIHPEDATSVLHTLPTGDTVSIPTPQTQAKTAASVYEIANKPKEEATRREKAAEEEANFKKAEAGKASDFSRTMMQKEYDDARAQENKLADDARNRYTQSQENYRARIAAEGRNKDTTIDLSPYAQQARDGVMTREEINKLPLTMRDKMSLTNAVVSSGGNIISNDQQQKLKDMATISTAVPKIDQMIHLIQTNPVAVRNPLTQEYKDFKELKDHLELILPNVARMVGDRGKLSNMQMQLVDGGYIPSRDIFSSNPQSVIKRRDDFVNLMNDMLNSGLTGANDEHKAYLKQNFGVKPLGKYGVDTNKPAAGQPAAAPQPQQGKKGVWTPQGIQWQ